MPPSAHPGIQLTPLMWPVNRVGMRLSPASAAASATCTSRRSAPRSTLPGSGWKVSHSRKMRTESRPLAAMTARSRETSPRSKLDHHAMAVRAGQ